MRYRKHRRPLTLAGRLEGHLTESKLRHLPFCGPSRWAVSDIVRLWLSHHHTLVVVLIFCTLVLQFLEVHPFLRCPS